jgi:phage-related minor tail protein
MTTEEMLVSLVENVKNINSTLNNMNKQFDDVNSKFDDINNQMSEMKADIQKMKNEIREISLTLENETNRNIKIIAEGHLDLSRKLDKALTVENEKEMALIRINMMENEIRRIKEKFA